MTPQAVMIFAAGLGTRMGELTRDRPKPLIEVAGRPLIDHALALARAAGVRRIVVNTHAHRRPDARPPGARRPRGADLARAGAARDRRRPEAGAAAARARPGLHAQRRHGLARAEPARPRSRPPGDRATARSSASCRAPRRSATPARATSSSDPDGRLRRRGAADTADFVYAGAQIIDPAALDGFPDGAFSLNPVWDALIADGRLRGIVHPGGWVDVGRPEGIALAEAELAR